MSAVDEYGHPPCCTACGGAGGTASGPCSDCYGTGHPHPPDRPKAVDEARRALRALYTAVPPDVAADVGRKVEAAFDELAAAAEPEWTPTQMFRAVGPDGGVWAEASDYADVRYRARPDDRIQRLYMTVQRGEWRDEP